MRILWNSHRDIRHARAGGAERTSHEIGKRLVSRGHSVTLVSAVSAGNPSRERIDGVSIRRFPGYISVHLATPFLVSGSSAPDVVVDDLAHVVPWGSPFFGRAPGTVFFQHLHARTLPGQVRPALARLLSKLERNYPIVYRRWPFVTYSEQSKRDLSSMGVESSRVTVIPPGVDLDLFTPRQKSDVPTLIHFAGLRAYKRADHALVVLRSLSRRGMNARLIIVGTGPDLGRIAALAREWGLADRTEFVGRVGHENLEFLAGRVGQAWVSLNCSTAEGWGIANIEAAAAGTPTVGYDVPGVAESVKQGESGILVPDGDLTALERATRDILGSPVSWTRACRQWAERFSWEKAAHSWESHLRQVSSSPH